MSEIDLEPTDPASRRLWNGVADLVELLPPDWVLIGGLMVQLHAFEHGGEEPRVTMDVDVLGQARPQGTLREIDSALRAHGFRLNGPDLDGYAHRYERDGLLVDVLAPDGIRPPPSLGPGLTAIGVPGGTQALDRSETVSVRIAGRAFDLRRPTLLGAILIKARALIVHADPDAQREDLILLLSLAKDPRAMSVELKRSERRWLRAVESRLALEMPAVVDAEGVRRARLALRLLLREE